MSKREDFPVLLRSPKINEQNFARCMFAPATSKKQMFELFLVDWNLNKSLFGQALVSLLFQTQLAPFFLSIYCSVTYFHVSLSFLDRVPKQRFYFQKAGLRIVWDIDKRMAVQMTPEEFDQVKTCFQFYNRNIRFRDNNFFSRRSTKN